MVPKAFVFLNLCEVTEMDWSQRRGRACAGGRRAPAPAVWVGRGCRRKGVRTSKAALPLSSWADEDNTVFSF